MALIRCPECQAEVSSLAKSCPHCGCPLNVNNGYTVTYTIQSFGAMAQSMHSMSVSNISQGVIENIQKNGGKIININKEPPSYLPLMNIQVIVFTYEAPKQIFQNTRCTVNIKKQPFGIKPQIETQWEK